MDQAAVRQAEKKNGDTEALKPLSSPRRPLLPILPQHQPPAGAIVVDKEETRVVYLAPLMPTAKEIYFAKHKELLKGKNNTEVNREEQEAEQRSKRQMLASLECHLSVLQKPSQQLGYQNQQPSSSVFAVPSVDDLQHNNVLTPDEDRASFWETVRGYEKMRAYSHQSVLAGGASTPMGFNMEAAFKRMLLVERHLLWVNTHESRLEGNKMRKLQEDESYERRVIETSSEFRTRRRLQKRIREQLICEAQNMQPIVMLGAFTQKMLSILVLHWSHCRLESNLSRTVRIWRQHRSIKRTNSQAAHLLIEWVQKSVAVKSVSFRVFQGLRIFIRRIKKVQGLWRIKQAIRRLKVLIMEKAWMELEAQYVDAAIEEHESRRLEAEQHGGQKKSPKSGSKQRNKKKREIWMRFVPDSVRVQVILEFLQKVEKEYQEKFRNQEVDFFPQLVQTLRAIHERELAEMIHNIPCKNKFIALELCQTQEPKDKITDDAETIHHRIHEQFFVQLHNQLVQLRLKALLERGVQMPSNEEITEETVRSNPKLLNLILMQSCDVKSEVPVRANEEHVSNFLLRFRDAFRGAAISPKLDEDEVQQGPRHSLFAKEVAEYVCKAVRDDAAKHNTFVYAEYKSQVRTRYEQAAEFQDITHTPSMLGAEYALDFGLGEIPEPPTVPPTPPLFVASTLNSISLNWSFVSPASNSQLPVVKRVSGRDVQLSKY
ncbi:uncharacterized protein KRP23_6193 [Phytophthora ramorum]|uniref:uncharacterized protein n=1 Tax=Phytophthora ramorum TaxID=164328 RepID=UPI0030AD2BBB|nr:hypothetical protein KRP23_6193 [Phytophthora ramorum]